MEKKYPIDLEEQANAIYQKYCADLGIIYHLPDAANFCLGYMAGKQATAGAVWVKASDRLPEPMSPPILIPVKRYEVDPARYSVRAMTANQFVDIIKWDLATFEWLDESGANEAVACLQSINLTDMDAPIFTHTKEFEAHFSYIKLKMIELISKK
jgi:hypothetical protein